MSDATKNAEKIQTQSPLKNQTRILANEEVFVRPSPDAATPDAGVRSGITIDGSLYIWPPFEPERKIIWAVKKALAEELTDKRRSGLVEALDALDEGKVEFLAGAVVGIGLAFKDVVGSYLRPIADLIAGYIEFQRLATDPEIWVRSWEIWSGADGSSEEFKDLAAFLKSNYPGFWMAIQSYPRARASVETFFSKLEQQGAIATFFVMVIDALVGTLKDDETGKDHLDQFIGLKGRPYDQGVLVARGLGYAVMQCILVILDVKLFTASLLKLGRKIIREVPELVNTLKPVIKQAPDLAELPRALEGIELETKVLYERAASEIKPYDKLTDLTYKFNQNCNEMFIYREEKSALGNAVEFIGLRLDADHILEDRTYYWFEKEFKALGYASPNKMDAIAVHTEFHIRTGGTEGRGLKYVFKIEDDALLGKPSLTKMKMDFIGKDPKKYANFMAFIEDYELFYKTKVSLYYPKVEQWFNHPVTGIKARIRALGL